MEIFFKRINNVRDKSFRLTGGLIIALISIFFVGGLLCGQNLPVDLAKRNFYGRQGFAANEIYTFPPKSDVWKKIYPVSGSSLFTPLDISAEPSEEGFEFTILSSFVIDDYSLGQGSIGLWVPHIGERWELYLNGRQLVYFYMPPLHTVCWSAYQKNVLIELPSTLCRDGYNTLAFRIYGAPSRKGFTGLGINGLRVDRYARLASEKSRIMVMLSLKIVVVLLVFVFSLYMVLLDYRIIHRYWYALCTIGFLIYLTGGSNVLFLFMGNSVIDAWLLIAGMLLFFSSCLVYVLTVKTGVSRLELGIVLPFWSICAVALLVLSLLDERSVLLLTGITLFLSMLVSFLMILIQHKGNIKAARGGFDIFSYSLKGGAVLAFVCVMLVYGYTGSQSLILILLWSVVTVGYFMAECIRQGRYNRRADNLESERKLTFEDFEKTNSELAESLDENRRLEKNNSELLEQLNRVEQRSWSESEITSYIQKSIFPLTVPATDNYELAFYAENVASVGTNMYDFYVSEGSLRGVSLFEPSNSGLAAGLVTILVRSLIYRRFIQLYELTLGAIFEKVNKDLVTELGGKKIYLAGQILKFHESAVEYINAGHTELLYRNTEKGFVKKVAPSDRDYKSTMLGGNQEYGTFNTIKFTVNKGDYLLLYSEGYPGCTNMDGKFYGLKEISDVFESLPPGRGIQDTLEYMLKNMRNYRQRSVLKRDIVIILIRKL